MTRRGYDACPPANANPRRKRRDAARRAATLGKWRATGTGLWELSTARGGAAVLKVHRGCWVVSVSETGAAANSLGEFGRLSDAKHAAVNGLSVLEAAVKPASYAATLQPPQPPHVVLVKASGRFSTTDIAELVEEVQFSAATFASERLKRLIEDRPRIWLCGYAAALSNIIRTHGETSLAKSAMDSDNLTLAMFEEAGAEKFDLDALRRAR